jgi:histidine triad (HIT) family protein
MTADKGCIFCRIAAKEIPAKILFDEGGVVAFEDIKPAAPRHVVIIPKEHIGRISDLTGSSASIAGSLVLAANRIARRLGIADSGYRLVFNCNRDAGQEVFHIHLHLLGGRKLAWPPG